MPPPTPTDTSAPSSRMVWATRAASALVHSPSKPTSTASSPAASMLPSTVSPTMPFTVESHSTIGFLPSMAR